jgi:hypothetical protein
MTGVGLTRHGIVVDGRVLLSYTTAPVPVDAVVRERMWGERPGPDWTLVGADADGVELWCRWERGAAQ